ncbi:MAG: triphosphoribosyl-dephospho-CoA synthase [Pirellulaceae bacterium]|nr:triphosphoribosyl-dephospho-CoA synthase [Pirellulaceae bacterium]
MVEMQHRDSATSTLSTRQCVELACLLEVAAPKPGNVHRGADFPHIGLTDFLTSAVAIAPALERTVETGVGQAVLSAIQGTRQFVEQNTNLGIVLLLAPLSAIPPTTPLSSGIGKVLANLTNKDTSLIYQAIRLAAPRGLGTSETWDIDEETPDDLLTAMQIAAPRDMIARQYVNNFQQIFENIVPWIVVGCANGLSLTQSIVHTHVRCMAEFPDTDIARKIDVATASESAQRAGSVLKAGDPMSEDYETALANFDFWLRSDGTRRNPGTTADLIVAGLFISLRDGIIKPPFR